MPLNSTAAQISREADISWLQSRQELPYWEIPSTLHPREEEHVQLLPLALAGLVSTLLHGPGREVFIILRSRSRAQEP